jgi:hypothetical protein
MSRTVNAASVCIPIPADQTVMLVLVFQNSDHRLGTLLPSLGSFSASAKSIPVAHPVIKMEFPEVFIQSPFQPALVGSRAVGRRQQDRRTIQTMTKGIMIIGRAYPIEARGNAAPVR